MVNNSTFILYKNREKSLFEKIDNQYSQTRDKKIDICKKENNQQERMKLFSQKDIVYCGR